MTAQQSDTHDREIINQFTLQADAFAEKHASHEAAFQLALEVTGVTANDTVLDVACGPGLITCAFAQVAQRVVGADLTPAMLERARHLQTEKGLHNLAWDIAAGESLPYRDESFSLVISRYSFHHFLQPNVVLAEMIRVGRSGGRV